RLDLSNLCALDKVDLTGGMLDQNPPIDFCPVAGRGYVGQESVIVRDEKGRSLAPNFKFQEVVENQDGSLAFYLRDAHHLLTYIARFEAHPENGLISCEAQIVSETNIYVDWLSAPVIPVSAHSQNFMDFAGRWCGEFRSQKHEWSTGSFVRENRTGRTGHEYFPGLLIEEEGVSENHGNVFAMHYAWSGGHKMVVEELPDGRRLVQFGHMERSFKLSDRNFETGKLFLAFSHMGRNGVAASFQKYLRDLMASRENHRATRPVHYNCWEAIYFDHSLEDLKEIANRAAELGAERFVLDDGWFKGRNNDLAALGDWVVDAKKYPNGLGPLVDHIKSLDMEFGIWFEPEMINEDSDLYRAHPDWVLGPTDQIRGRQQLVLNLALPEIRDYLFDHISAILSQYDVGYVKWDHNRILPLFDEEQTQGLYKLLDRLVARFPSVEFESCSSGGGRIDFDILSRMGRVWLSDSNDAQERVRIQHEAALFLPACVTGSHVGPDHCHTSGRVHDISFRSWVAAQRHMGFEMDPRDLDDNSVAVLKEVTRWWKENRSWLMQATIMRLDIADPALMGELHLSADLDRFVVFVNRIDVSDQIAPRPVRFCGLKADQMYDLHLRNRGDLHHLSRGNPAIKQQDVCASGQYLMSHGLA
ncbi:MAG: alpha-galactosidase, partial [Alphaproteobacteria bacterium]|nr:alpha-galactosidase [Alphaproteobacteria bacterium]